MAWLAADTPHSDIIRPTARSRHGRFLRCASQRAIAFHPAFGNGDSPHYGL